MKTETSIFVETAAPRVLAVFDLDGTLTRGDTLFPFLLSVTGLRSFVPLLLRALPALAGMLLRLLPRQRAKETVLRIFLRGMTKTELEQRGRVFATQHLPRMMRPQALECLAWHRARGHRCVLLSASPTVYAEPWARAAGFDEVIATELHCDAAGRITGRLTGNNCQGMEKVRRLEAHFGDLVSFNIYGYGDSPGDRHFLARCTQANSRPFRGPEHAQAPQLERNRPADLLKLMRPHQWVKNLFVFVGLMFGHAWNNPTLVAAALLAAAAFSLAASAIYIVNDLIDRERDRLHPVKRNRPLASGRVTPAVALELAAALALGGGALALAAGQAVAWVVATYVVMNVAYSLALKNVVILDVFVIAAGFMLRILAGTLGIGIAPSQWLLLCGFLLTLFLGFTKRRAELLSLSADSDSRAHRQSLAEYGSEMLDKLIVICAGGVIMSYSLYTMSPDTIRIHGTTGLIYTVPFVLYGVFRYLHLLHREQAGTDTAKDLVRDPHLLACVAGWVATTLLLIS